MFDQYNKQLSTNVIANSYTLYAYVLKTVDSKVGELILLDPKIKFEKIDRINLFVTNNNGNSIKTDKHGNIIARKIKFQNGSIELAVNPSKINKNGLVLGAPSMIFNVLGESADIPSLSIKPSYPRGGSISFAGPSLRYKKMEVKYPYKDVHYSPRNPDLLNDSFKNNFTKKFTLFMKFAWSVCNE